MMPDDHIVSTVADDSGIEHAAVTCRIEREELPWMLYDVKRVSMETPQVSHCPNCGAELPDPE